MQGVPIQRVGPLAGLPGLLAEFGVPIEAALAGSDLTADMLVPDARVPLTSLVALLERSARLAGCADFGLRLGLRQDLRCLGAMGEMMRRAPTLGDALRDYVGLQIGYSRGAVVYLRQTEDGHAIGYGLYQQAGEIGRHVYDLVVAVGCNMVRALTDGRARPLRVLLCCAAPAQPRLYASALRAPVLFDQEQTGVIVSARDMDLPLAGADPAERLRLRDTIHRMALQEFDDTAAQVRHALRPRLMTGDANRDRVAMDLGIHPRTLSRRLSASGTTFEAIKDEVRYAIARELLALTRMPVGQIAMALSYATNSAFDHAFARWSGASPSAWRRRETAGSAKEIAGT